MEMLTPSGVSIHSLFCQGDVQWENQLRRKRNRQNRCDWILFPPSLQVKEKHGIKKTALKLLQPMDLVAQAFFEQVWKSCENRHFRL
jgi:hypothetical protein